MEWIECPECDGEGQIEIEVPKPHAGGFNLGYIDSKWIDCEQCEGSGEIEKEYQDEE